MNNSITICKFYSRTFMSLYQEKKCYMTILRLDEDLKHITLLVVHLQFAAFIKYEYHDFHNYTSV